MDAHNNLGAVSRIMGRRDAAITHFRRARDLRPADPRLWGNLGAMLYEAGILEEARHCLNRSIEIKSDTAEPHYNLGLVYQKEGRLDDAVACYRRALELRSTYSESHHNLGAVFVKQGRFQAARQQFAKALALKPDYHKVRVDEALMDLLLGDLEKGWEGYEHRYQLEGFPKLPRLWDGSPLTGTLMVIFEQGLGDTIQFIRYLPQARKRCGRLLFFCPAPLKRLLADFPGIDGLPDDFRSTPSEAQISLLSLPRLFGTRLDSIPADVPYLRAPESLRTSWATAVDPYRLNVGLVWAGNPQHQTDWARSLHLADFAPLARSPEWCSIPSRWDNGPRKRLIPPMAWNSGTRPRASRIFATPPLSSPTWIWSSPWIPRWPIWPGPWAGPRGFCCPTCPTGAGSCKATPRRGTPP